MKKSIIAVVIAAAVFASGTLFLAGWFVAPTLFGSYGHGYGWRCWNGHGPGGSAMMNAPWMRGGPPNGKNMHRHRDRCGCPWRR